jgi:dephospho-CoA kinase
LEKIKLTFGPQIIVNGELDRKQLGRIVFDNPVELDRLNTIMQPAIQSAMQDKIQFHRLIQTPVLIADIPLLIERDYQHQVDLLVVVNIPRDVQFERLKQRDQLTDKEANARIDAQMPLSKKVELADVVIDNGGDLTATQEQVMDLIADLKQLQQQA